jgi:aryl-phospho-beta-D-glucosidase BglC (GH1 family)
VPGEIVPVPPVPVDVLPPVPSPPLVLPPLVLPSVEVEVEPPALVLAPAPLPRLGALSVSAAQAAMLAPAIMRRNELRRGVLSIVLAIMRSSYQRQDGHVHRRSRHDCASFVVSYATFVYQAPFLSLDDRQVSANGPRSFLAPMLQLPEHMRLVSLFAVALLNACAQPNCETCSGEYEYMGQTSRPAGGSNMGGSVSADGSNTGSAGAGAGATGVAGSAQSTGGSGGSAYGGSYVRANGHDMLDVNGKRILLRAMNLGNWLHAEGYMWHFFPDNGIGVRHRVIEQKVGELLGPAAAAAFWSNLHQRYITLDDLNAIKSMGFNSVRLPLNARFLLPEGSVQFREEGFQAVQHALDLARSAGLYVILDMHAAPGGQAGKDIDDSPDYCAELFLNNTNQDRLVALWRAIAERWANDPIIAGFDLINEPIPWRDQLWDKCRPSETDYWYKFILALYPLYQRIGAAIREVDPNHMLIVQGAYWGSDVSVSLGDPFDANMTYSFHFYHTAANDAEVQEYVDARDRWNRPIWVGEFGEDTNQHYQSLVNLFESKNFGWAFWTWKRINAPNTPYSINYPDKWHVVEGYIVDNRTPPSDFNAVDTFNSFLNNVTFSNCSANWGTINVLSR